MNLASEIALLFDSMRHDFRGICNTSYTLYMDEARMDRELDLGLEGRPEEPSDRRPEYIMGFPVIYVRDMGWEIMIKGESDTEEWYGCDTGTSEVP